MLDRSALTLGSDGREPYRLPVTVVTLVVRVTFEVWGHRDLSFSR